MATRNVLQLNLTFTTTLRLGWDAESLMQWVLRDCNSSPLSGYKRAVSSNQCSMVQLLVIWWWNYTDFYRLSIMRLSPGFIFISATMTAREHHLRIRNSIKWIKRDQVRITGSEFNCWNARCLGLPMTSSLSVRTTELCRVTRITWHVHI